MHTSQCVMYATIRPRWTTELYESLNVNRIVLIYVQTNYVIVQYDTFDFIADMCSVKICIRYNFSTGLSALP